MFCSKAVKTGGRGMEKGQNCVWSHTLRVVLNVKTVSLRSVGRVGARLVISLYDQALCMDNHFPYSPAGLCLSKGRERYYILLIRTVMLESREYMT